MAQAAEAPAHRPEPPPTPAVDRRARRRRRAAVGGAALAAVAVGAWFGYPAANRAITTVSTDDAYVNGHVTFVAPRVGGLVLEVPVEDNNRVQKGQLLTRLDPEPYRVQVQAKRAAVEAAKADLTAATAQVRATEAQARSLRWKLETAIQQVDNQVAFLRARIAALRADLATLGRARADLARSEKSTAAGAGSQEELDQRRQAVAVAAAQLRQGLEEVNQVRVGLGLAPSTARWDQLEKWTGDGPWNELAAVPPDLNQTYAGVRQALAELVQAAAQFSPGFELPLSEATPAEVLKQFRDRDARGDIDRVLREAIPGAPAVLQATAKLRQAEEALAQAELDLRYTEVRAEIDGAVSRRSANPGNYVQPGQQLMAVRSLTDIWVDCNFKETQLADLRIGQRVELFVDMYPGRAFAGRVTGFTPGTGSTLSLFPAQNATGNFVKVVQRLPVRVDLIDPPADAPLFPGLSVVPYVYYKEPATGPDAGGFLQPPLAPASSLAPPVPQATAPPSRGPFAPPAGPRP
ncbi:MAG: HlyD family secretion protein [Planctomycetes bacterium]|nr:HlyD family secretion protein [Planctomycetota bacterium]